MRKRTLSKLQFVFEVWATYTLAIESINNAYRINTYTYIAKILLDPQNINDITKLSRNFKISKIFNHSGCLLLDFILIVKNLKIPT